MAVEIGNEGVTARTFIEIEHPVCGLLAESPVFLRLYRGFCLIPPKGAMREENGSDDQKQQDDFKEGQHSLLFRAITAPNHNRLQAEPAPMRAGLQRVQHGRNRVSRRRAARTKAEFARQQALLAFDSVEADLLPESRPAE